MNKKVFISMLILTISFLISLYVLKIFFPQEFMMSIQNEQLIKIGAFIDSNFIIRHICGTATTFITYWLFCCACSRRKSLKLKECIIILVCSIALRFLNSYDLNLATHVSISLFFILPVITKGNIGIMALCYSIHGLSQILSLGIRNLPIYLVNYNYLTVLFMGLESYFWLILLYIIFNYQKKEI